MNAMMNSFTLPMPVIESVRALSRHLVQVKWTAGLRAGKTELVDLSPVIRSYKFYRPLRDNAELFADIHVRDSGNTIGWGDETAELEMPATNVERLAEETMTGSDFKGFLVANKLTHAAAAAALGRGRRQIENYLTADVVPRVVALACYGWAARKQGIISKQLPNVYVAATKNLAATSKEMPPAFEWVPVPGTLALLTSAL